MAKQRSGNVARVLSVIGGYHIMALALAANLGEGVSKVAIIANAGAFLDAIITGDYSRMVRLTWMLALWSVVFFLSILVKDSALGSYLEQGMVRLRMKTVEVLSRTKMSWLANRHTGELSARVSSDLNALSGALRPILVLNGSAVLRQAITIGYLLFLNWKLTFIVFSIVPVTMFIQWVVSKPIKEYRAVSQNAMGRLTSVLFDCFGGFETVKSLVLEKEMRRRFDSAQKTQYEAILKEERINALLTPFSWINQYLPQFILIIAGGIFIINGSLTIGGVTVFLGLSSDVIYTLGNMSTLFPAIRQLGVHADRIGSLWNVPVEESGISVSSAENASALVQMNNVTYSYAMESGESSRPILKGVSLTVRKGEFIAVVGESGSGKSTILKLIASLYDTNGGDISYYGIPRAEWDIQSLRRNIAYVTQDTYLFPGSLGYNVAGGDDSIPESRIIEALKTAQLGSFLESLPEGLGTEVGERGVFLSGGQRQRISIARALCKEADILLLDEATSALDQKTEEAVISAILEMERRPALLFVTHRIQSARQADRIVVVKNGLVCGEGSHEWLSVENDEYRKLLTAQKGDAEYA